MLDKVKTWCLKHHLIDNNDKLIVACSGGPDSLAMLNILQQLSQEFNLTLIVAHFNHKLRGQESDEDEAFVKAFAQANNLTFASTGVDVNQYCQNNKLSLEEGARILRYQYLRTLAQQHQADKIAVGHNKDDQAETVLLNLLRGAGSCGIAGISAKSCDIIRPLLSTTRTEIESYCQQEKLVPRIDKSNLEPCYLRNKIRLKLLPQLLQYNNSIVETLWKTAEVIGTENDYLATEAQKVWTEVISITDEIIVVKKGLFNNLHKALQRVIIRQIIEQKQGHTKGISFEHIEKVINYVATTKSGGIIELPQQLLVENKYQEFQFYFATEKHKLPQIMAQELPVSATTILQGFSGMIKVEVLDNYVKPYDNQAIFDYDKIVLPLYVRSRKDGDVFKPQGFNGRKKLKKFFIDQKIDQDQRFMIPLLCDSTNQILWVLGYRQSSIASIDETTTKYLLLTKIQGV